MSQSMLLCWRPHSPVPPGPSISPSGDQFLEQSRTGIVGWQSQSAVVVVDLISSWKDIFSQRPLHIRRGVALYHGPSSINRFVVPVEPIKGPTLESVYGTYTDMATTLFLPANPLHFSVVCIVICDFHGYKAESLFIWLFGPTHLVEKPS